MYARSGFKRSSPLTGVTIEQRNYFKAAFENQPKPSIDKALDAYKGHQLPLLNRFLVRNLSRSSDMHDAFAGILNAMRTTLRKYPYGLPILILVQALLWDRYVVDRYKSCCITRRPGFPSWSWMGWEFSKGVSLERRIGFVSDTTALATEFTPIIRIYGVEDSTTSLRILCDIRQIFHLASIPQLHPVDEEPQLPALADLQPPLSQCLIFWGSCASFPVSFITTLQNEHGDGLYAIDTGYAGGQSPVSLPSSWRVKQTQELEFVAIAGTFGNGIYTMLSTAWMARQPERKLVVLG
ncbi:hypothetical protein BDV96DRAFT_691228 [Lophiotrema nucula]|uniref:Uncharacterized protein n=1 Tax=Lophiotrema nucula TaxID=690887 RepID=A0A6A5YWF9_9PLEO|nr:hypothetical protein BDV96DRAFT_691228 [Lophiotrema nucula]